MDFAIQISETSKYKTLFNIKNLHFCQYFSTFALAILKGHADCGSEVCYREELHRSHPPTVLLFKRWPNVRNLKNKIVYGKGIIHAPQLRQSRKSDCYP